MRDGGGELDDYIAKKLGPGAEAPSLLKGVLQSLDQIHRQNWAHRDLKGPNCAVNGQGVVRNTV